MPGIRSRELYYEASLNVAVCRLDEISAYNQLTHFKNSIFSYLIFINFTDNYVS